MIDSHTFNSRSPLCKTPYGAVPSGERVSFTLRPERSAAYVRAVLTARLEGADNRRLELPMPWSRLDGDRDCFTCKLDTAGYIGLIWYSLRLIRMDGTGDETAEFQLTVYDGSESVPGWFGDCLLYTSRCV